MDVANPFETPTTFRLHRAEYLVGVAVTTVLIVVHASDIRWPVFIGLFLYIDLVGYIPGAIAYHRSQTKRINRTYYVLYNVMHSLITQSAVIGLWALLFGWEWALLAIPFHLFGDRGLFGNFMKPFALDFEPHRAAGYTSLIADLAREGRTDAPALAAAAVPAPGGEPAMVKR